MGAARKATPGGVEKAWGGASHEHLWKISGHNIKVILFEAVPNR